MRWHTDSDYPRPWQAVEPLAVLGLAQELLLLLLRLLLRLLLLLGAFPGERGPH